MSKVPQTADEFYNDKNSVYFRLMYDPDTETYQVVAYREIIPETEAALTLVLLARGMAEIIQQKPQEIYDIGYKAALRDQAAENILGDELINNPQGNA